MKRKLTCAKEDPKEIQKVKAETPFSVRLYAGSDGKVRSRAGREGVSVAQVICDVVDEYYRRQELLPDDLERLEERVAELRRLQKTIEQVSDELNTQRVLFKTQLAQIGEQLNAQTSNLHIGKLLGNAQYKLLGLIFEQQLMSRQLLLQYLVDPHLKDLGADVDIHQILARTHSPNEHFSDGTKAVLRVADHAAQQERLSTCCALLDESVAPQKEPHASSSTAETAPSFPLSTDQVKSTSAIENVHGEES